MKETTLRWVLMGVIILLMVNIVLNIFNSNQEKNNKEEINLKIEQLILADTKLANKQLELDNKLWELEQNISKHSEDIDKLSDLAVIQNEINREVAEMTGQISKYMETNLEWAESVMRMFGVA